VFPLGMGFHLPGFVSCLYKTLFNDKSGRRLLPLGRISCLMWLSVALNSSLFTQDKLLNSAGLEDFNIMLRVSITK